MLLQGSTSCITVTGRPDEKQKENRLMQLPNVFTGRVKKGLIGTAEWHDN